MLSERAVPPHHIRRDHDPGHCPAFGTGELRRNDATL
jgi:hypothetical protein